MIAGSERIGMVRGISGFGELSDEAASGIAAACELVSVPEEAALFETDDASLDAYFIVSGVVSLRSSVPGSIPRPGTRPPESLVLRSGALFGVLSFLDGARRDMDAVARERCVLLRLDGPRLKAACEADAELGRTVYAAFGAAAARNARDVFQELRNLLAERGR